MPRDLSTSLIPDQGTTGHAIYGRCHPMHALAGNAKLFDQRLAEGRVREQGTSKSRGDKMIVLTRAKITWVVCLNSQANKS